MMIKDTVAMYDIINMIGDRDTVVGLSVSGATLSSEK